MCSVEDDVAVAGGRDEQVGDLHDVFDPDHLQAVHRRLQRADGVHLGNHDPGALTAEGLDRTLTDVAVSTDHRQLAAEHDVGCPVQAVHKRVADTVLVVELGLCHGVVHVDGREQQLTVGGEPVQTLDPVRRLLGDTPDLPGHAREPLTVGGQAVSEHIEHDMELGRVRLGRLRNRSGRLELNSLVDE